MQQNKKGAKAPFLFCINSTDAIKAKQPSTNHCPLPSRAFKK